ncbi:MAG: hypothetical protein JWM47_3088 [Acidimicrobiales bacterium]|nr:hypothetical protein [Acidimicrobiales bacterium]
MPAHHDGVMAYRIDPALRPAAEIRRVLAEQLHRAAEVLRVEGGPDAEAVHDARKRVKKARSLVRLARAELGPAVARHANAELRRVGADLATQRDADALVEALDRLLQDTDDGPTRAALADVRARFVERADAVRDTGSLDRATVVGAARVLEQLVTWIALVPYKAEGWDALAAGLRRQYRRGRTALGALPDEPSDEELHEWRKRVKDLWYHQRLLRGLWPEAQRPVVAAADELASALGDDHDLALLLAHLVPAGDGDGPEGHPVALPPDRLELVATAARAERSRLQLRARELGARLYADDPDGWTSRHGAWWAAAGRQARTGADADAPEAGPVGDEAVNRPRAGANA